MERCRPLGPTVTPCVHAWGAGVQPLLSYARSAAASSPPVSTAPVRAECNAMHGRAALESGSHAGLGVRLHAGGGRGAGGARRRRHIGAGTCRVGRGGVAAAAAARQRSRGCHGGHGLSARAGALDQCRLGHSGGGGGGERGEARVSRGRRGGARALVFVCARVFARARARGPPVVPQRAARRCVCSRSSGRRSRPRGLAAPTTTTSRRPTLSRRPPLRRPPVRTSADAHRARMRSRGLASSSRTAVPREHRVRPREYRVSTA
jgi:hypothetical protein